MELFDLPVTFNLDAAAGGEDDGWVLAYVYDATEDGSDVVVLDAQDFTGPPVATVHLPDRAVARHDRQSARGMKGPA